MKTLEGYWTGEISGTSSGGLSVSITQAENMIQGTAKISESNYEFYHNYAITNGSTSEDGNGFCLFLSPIGDSPIELGDVEAKGRLINPNRMTARWTSTNGAEGNFTLNRDESEGKEPAGNSVFIVHGHDDATKEKVARFVEKLGLKAVILHEQPNQGRTIIEKFEKHASESGFAIVLFTPDDIGYPKDSESLRKPRARQNVLLEFGFFIGRIGRGNVAVLYKGDVELPSDILGVVYTTLDDGDAWKKTLFKELEGARFALDPRRLLD